MAMSMEMLEAAAAQATKVQKKYVDSSGRTRHYDPLGDDMDDRAFPSYPPRAWVRTSTHAIAVEMRPKVSYMEIAASKAIAVGGPRNADAMTPKTTTT